MSENPSVDENTFTQVNLESSEKIETSCDNYVENQEESGPESAKDQEESGEESVNEEELEVAGVGDDGGESAEEDHDDEEEEDEGEGENDQEDEEQGQQDDDDDDDDCEDNDVEDEEGNKVHSTNMVSESVMKEVCKPTACDSEHEEHAEAQHANSEDEESNLSGVAPVEESRVKPNTASKKRKEKKTKTKKGSSSSSASSSKSSAKKAIAPKEPTPPSRRSGRAPKSKFEKFTDLNLDYDAQTAWVIRMTSYTAADAPKRRIEEVAVGENESSPVEVSESQNKISRKEKKLKAPKEKKPRKKKDPNAPKGAKSAYAFFVAEKAPEIKKKEPGVSFVQVSKAVASLWKDTTDKTAYDAKALEDKERYKSDLEIYKDCLADMSDDEEEEKEERVETKPKVPRKQVAPQKNVVSGSVKASEEDDADSVSEDDNSETGVAEDIKKPQNSEPSSDSEEEDDENDEQDLSSDLRNATPMKEDKGDLAEDDDDDFEEETKSKDNLSQLEVPKNKEVPATPSSNVAEDIGDYATASMLPPPPVKKRAKTVSSSSSMPSVPAKQSFALPKQAGTCTAPSGQTKKKKFVPPTSRLSLEGASKKSKIQPTIGKKSKKPMNSL